MEEDRLNRAGQVWETSNVWSEKTGLAVVVRTSKGTHLILDLAAGKPFTVCELTLAKGRTVLTFYKRREDLEP